MTETFASPSDVAEAITKQAVQLRVDAHRESHAAAEFGGSINGHDIEHERSAMRDDALVECLGYVLGTTDEGAAEDYIAGWAAKNGIELGEAAVRVRDMPNASQLSQQRAQGQILDALREAGAAGLSREALSPLLAKLGWRGEDQWLRQSLSAGTLIRRHQGRSDVYLHSDFAVLRTEDEADTTS
ncbi:hypothetical protein OG455_27275 [Kitasatospora sp. NBC_01287]|uniref:hypothetical protein n=1 Tax=Kitasatospora sp. NBC_01287 TaxID=2903573 RepID=UPI002251A849|nr:hypothetical protein [Kitasatospora sp. NBC_01287]MCX4749165.1 hypothetical protein [Kitasatospora sp. NBC_01287]